MKKTGLLYTDTTVSLSYMYVNNLCIVQPTAKTQYRKSKTNIPRKGTAPPLFQFPHSCVCERFIYSHDRSAFSAEENMWTDPGNI
jgi:hypothetical protein